MRRTPPEFQITAKVRSALSCHGYPLASIATAQALNPGSIEENETMSYCLRGKPKHCGINPCLKWLSHETVQRIPKPDARP
jgi:hypothetical protein